MQPAADTTLLEADQLGLMLHDRRILSEVSLRIGPRDFITLIGPNGAGKSMLLKCLMGLVAPTSGHVRRADGVRIGYVPQQFRPDAMIPIHVADFLKLRKKVDASYRDDIVAQTGIESLLLQPLSVLSGGEMQRVLLARALMSEPQLLVLDEPAQNLDVNGQLALYQLLDQIYDERGISILMVSHDLHLVMASTRQVICLFQHVCCSGEPQAVARDPAFTALFGDELARRMAVYHHSHDHDHDHSHDHPQEDGACSH